MDDKKFTEEYRRTFDGVRASDELRRAVLDAKPSRRRTHVVSPFKATLGTVAAAIMIFAAVNEYKFEPDTSGVISETVVTTETPRAEFVAGVTEAPATPDTVVATASPTKKPTAIPQQTQNTAPTIEPKIVTEVPMQPEQTAQADDNEPVVARSGGGGGGGRSAQAEDDVSVTETEPYDESLSGTIEPTDTGFKGYVISNGIYYIIEGADETAVLEKMATL